MEAKRIIYIFLYVILFALVVIGASAQPPFQEFSGTTGYEIEYPFVEYIAQDSGFDFHFHIFNQSNGVPIDNTSTTCIFHLYNSTGNHIHTGRDATLSNDYDFAFDIDGANFSDVGIYSYMVQCNSTTEMLGGFASAYFYVTPEGVAVEEYNNTSFYIITLIYIFLTILCLVPMFFVQDYLKVILGLGASFLVMTLTRLAAWFVEITNPAETNLIDTLNHYFSFGTWAFRGMLIFAVFYTIIFILNIVTSDRKRKKKEKEWENE